MEGAVVVEGEVGVATACMTTPDDCDGLTQVGKKLRRNLEKLDAV